MHQPNLFRMPKIKKRIQLSDRQREVLDWVELRGGKFALFPGRLSKVSMRKVLAMGLVERVNERPARYVLTGYGRAVRARHIAKAKQPRLGEVTRVLITDSAVD